MTIKEEAVKPNRYIINLDGNQVECRYVLEELIKRNIEKISPISSPYYTNAFEYLFRLYDKHEDPETDIRKAIQELIFLLEAETGKKTELKDMKDIEKEDYKLQDYEIKEFENMPDFPKFRRDK
ncbi:MULTISPECIES: hypothetical protein [unclassified Gemella]|uniref:hypothetical protein n=1 Tax=unclassified Gemella TaxID=2624949 RepID=UPI0010735A2C|nr:MULTISPECIES: hypothetical protein [unclassified Gemella]MBF0709750.1 hypothetical protein [Gemella sp. GL1.1]MBF0747268.1 hypothetical protein [Gemella sp. 19428wG2_WT2a]NYS27094.1 hypothetical protein [Gemella sp. GL1]TFU57853.1 hypothetical protein E4T67_06310 [Gemella sp. WT2a]